MKVVFRVDASLEMGSGHTMRCLTLADAFEKRGHTCQFIVREQPGHLIKLIKSNGYLVHVLPVLESEHAGIGEYPHSDWLLGGQQKDSEDTLAVIDSEVCDWLIVDHYGIGASWENKLRKVSRHILVIDDLADREHNCDVLLDQNLGRSEDDYDGLVPSGCRRLIGPKYALLRPEFSEWREKSLARRRHQTELHQVLISLGGVDKHNVTGDVLDALETSSLSDSVGFTVVLGQQSPWFEKIQHQAARSRFDVKVKQGVTNMAELMSQADLAIGAAGSTSWERCCLGLPAIMLVLARNQADVASHLNELGAAVSVDASREITCYLALKLNMFQDKVFIENMVDISSALVDGRGVDRVVDSLNKVED